MYTPFSFFTPCIRCKSISFITKARSSRRRPHPEAPHIYKKDGWYYLLIAEGGTELGHGVTIARSRDIYGPYTPNPSNPIMTNFCRAAQSNTIQGIGHADLVDAPDGSWWAVALGYRTVANGVHTLGRETMLAPVRWDEGAWPVVNGNGTVDTLMRAATLPQVPVKPVPTETDFTKLGRLGHEWVYLCNPHMENYVLDSRGLTLRATPLSLDDAGSPTWVGRRQQSHDAVCTTTFCLPWDAPAGTRAGITVYMERGSHYDFYIESLKEGYQHIVCEAHLNAIKHIIGAELIAPGVEVTLRIDCEPDMYSFSIFDRGKWNFFGKANARYLATETAGGFTGMTFGLFATGPDGGKAIFKSFSLE